MTEPLQTLRAMRELLADPRALCKKAQARDHQGNALPWNHLDARSWCLVWSAVKAANNSHAKSNAAIAALSTALGSPCVLDWNDAPERTHAEVLDLLDRGIAIAKEESRG